MDSDILAQFAQGVSALQAQAAKSVSDQAALSSLKGASDHLAMSLGDLADHLSQPRRRTISLRREGGVITGADVVES